MKFTVDKTLQDACNFVERAISYGVLPRVAYRRAERRYGIDRHLLSSVRKALSDHQPERSRKEVG